MSTLSECLKRIIEEMLEKDSPIDGMAIVSRELVKETRRQYIAAIKVENSLIGQTVRLSDKYKKRFNQPNDEVYIITSAKLHKQGVVHVYLDSGQFSHHSIAASWLTPVEEDSY